MALHDTQPMLLVREGDAPSLSEFLDCYAVPVFHFIYRMLLDPRLAEKLTADVLRRAQSTSRADVFRLAVQVVLRAISEGDAGNPSPRTAVEDAILALTPMERAALILQKYERMSGSEIAKVLACSESAVNPLLLRAYSALSRALAIQ